MTDVNEQFRIERVRQMENAADRAQWVKDEVAAGRARHVGNDRYLVTEGYDRGEYFQLTAAGEISLEHGLDMTTGKAALYTRVPTWHALGTVIPEGVSDIDTVLKLAGLDYQVEKRESIYRNPVTGLWVVKENEFRTHRMDTGAAIGTVGNVFEPLQNREGFEHLEALTGKFGVIWESAGALRDGARTFVSMRMPESVIIDPEGVADEIQLFLVALNSHDGSGKFENLATPWRPICGNTERMAVRDALVRWGRRHTSGIRDSVSEARATFAQSIKYFEQFEAEQQRLAQTPFGDAELEELVNSVWKEVDEDASKASITKRKKLLETLGELHANNTATLGKTAYAAERTITEWADWKRNLQPRSGSLKGNMAAARATAVLEDTAGELKSKAHRKLMLRVNA